jgi:hypothetical protein
LISCIAPSGRSGVCNVEQLERVSQNYNDGLERPSQNPSSILRRLRRFSPVVEWHKDRRSLHSNFEALRDHL